MASTMSTSVARLLATTTTATTTTTMGVTAITTERQASQIEQLRRASVVGCGFRQYGGP